MRRIIPLIALAFLPLVLFIAPAFAQQYGGTLKESKIYNTGEGVVFEYPKFGGHGVDRCARFGSSCGKGGADLFCNRQGHGKAHTWKTEEMSSTYVLGSGRVCKTGFCKGFSSVTCLHKTVAAKPEKRSDRHKKARIFDFPKVSGVVIDHCELFGRNCGRGGADRFCRTEGFSHASDWKTYKPGKTYVIGEQRVCNNSNCTGFSSVTCQPAKARTLHDPQPYNAPRRDKTFSYPTVRGVAIDHCVTFGRNCGRGGADLFCKGQGYDHATRWDTFRPGQTYVAGAKGVCTNASCTGFSSVTCSDRHTQKTPARHDRGASHGGGGLGAILPFLLKPDAQPVSPFFRDSFRPQDRGRIGNSFGRNSGTRTGEIRRFAFPQFNGVSIDTCIGEGIRCERGGAERFCRSRGFVDALQWNTHRPGATWYTATNRQCRGSRCVGITDLVCAN